jgi:hypothetical protein
LNLKQYLLDKIVQAVLPVVVDRAANRVAKALEQKVQENIPAPLQELTKQDAIPVDEVAKSMGLNWPAISDKELP